MNIRKNIFVIMPAMLTDVAAGCSLDDGMLVSTIVDTSLSDDIEKGMARDEDFDKIL